MENNNFEKVEFDYFSNSPSYLRMILEMLPECMVSTQKKHMIRTIYNNILNRSNENDIKEIAVISILFRDKLSTTSLDDIVRFVKYIYELYIEKMLSDVTNRGSIFDTLNDCMKLYVGYLSFNLLIISFEHFSGLSSSNLNIKSNEIIL